MPDTEAPTTFDGYLRVSTQEQVDNGAGLDIQEDAVRGRLTADGLPFGIFLTDAAESGSNGLESRVALGDGLARIRAGESAGLVVYKLDRLARDVVLQEQILADVWAAGGRVISCSPAEDAYLEPDPIKGSTLAQIVEGDPSRTLIRQILGAVSQYERAMVRLRMATGRQRKAAAGGYAHGSPPYGWESVNAELVKVPSQQAALRRMHALRALGYSTRAIADVLNDEGFEPPGKRGSTAWSSSPVSRMLRRTPDNRRVLSEEELAE